MLHLAEANNSRALKGPVAAAGRVQTRGHPGLLARKVVGSAGCVSFCLFSANWPNEMAEYGKQDTQALNKLFVPCELQ